MKTGRRILRRWLLALGWDPRLTTRSIRDLPGYLSDLRKLKSLRGRSANDFPFGELYPCFGDKLAEGGSARGHYFHQDLLVARRIFLHRPSIHVDVGSRLDGFVAHVASFRPIEVLDIRPLPAGIPNVHFRQADLMEPIAEALVDYCDSLSCLHALEHFGLGRYGDRVEPDGHLVGLGNLRRMLKRGGRLYLSVPIGPQRIEFNAHRVFSLRYLLERLEPGFRLDRFSFVDDQGDLHEDVKLSAEDVNGNCGCHYGCGIFELVRL